MMSAASELRLRTANAHALVDAAFSAFDLGDRLNYLAFLTAHARALPTAEGLTTQNAALPASRTRLPLLAADMAALGQIMPVPLPLAGSGDGPAAWGILYVVEGSRLGGRLLAQRVAVGLPAAYLNARHESGEWRTLCRAIDAEAAQHNAAWLDDVTIAALACFDLYGRACDC